MSGKFDLSVLYIFIYIIYLYIHTPSSAHPTKKENPSVRFYSTVNCTSDELKVAVVAAAAGELRKMTCPMSRVREEEMGQKPNEMFLTPRFQHKSQVLHESTVCSRTRPEHQSPC